jgi:hypothetical protein
LLSLNFASGSRPALAALTALGAAEGPAHFVVTHAAQDGAVHWAELLSSGLTFDCLGLAPGAAIGESPCNTLLGLKSLPAGEAIALRPGPHIADGAALQPVLRVLLALADSLATLPGVAAVCWWPSQSAMEPKYFRRIVQDWLSGGAFPALGLTTLEVLPDGALNSRGLNFFVGQELAVQPGVAAKPEQCAQLAVRLIDRLITEGALSEPRAFAFDGLPPVIVAPVDGGRMLRVTRRPDAT